MADEMDASLARFEAQVDRSDPEQLRLLQQMKEHTRRLHQARGDWSRPSEQRNWNAAAPPPPRPPLADDAYRAYKEHRAKEEQRQKQQMQLLAHTTAAAGAEEEGYSEVLV